jgi:hypothetical protein
MLTQAPNSRRRLLFERSPGERAFDRALCFFVLFVLLCNPMLPIWLRSEDGASPPEAGWIPFAIGIAAFCIWAWLALGVVAAWHDPMARVLRVSSSLLLLYFAVIASCLLRVPFQ